MKFIVVGLGVFGSDFAEKLTNAGHEVLAVDKSLTKVEAMKEKVTHAVCLDSADIEAVKTLPLRTTDIVVICIGENEGANIMATAVMKKLNVRRLVGRALSPLHRTILETMNITEILCPEAESADRWMKKLTNNSLLDSFELVPGFSVMEIEVPTHFINKSMTELQVRDNYNVLILTVLRRTFSKNIFGRSQQELIQQGIPDKETVFKDGDILVVYGKDDDIQKLSEL